jgi:hypothetical protein
MVRSTCPEKQRWKLGRWRGTLDTLRMRYRTPYGPDMEMRTFTCRVPGASVTLEQVAFLVLREHRVFPRAELFDGSSPELAVKYEDVLRRLASTERAPPPAAYAGSTAAEVAEFVAWCAGRGLEVRLAPAASDVPAASHVPDRGRAIVTSPLERRELLTRVLLTAPDLEEDDEAALMARAVDDGGSTTRWTVEDRAAYLRARYKAAWGLRTVDAAFLAECGPYEIRQKTALLLSVALPDLAASCDDAMDAMCLLRAPLIRQTLDALGFAHPFDTAHVVGDIDQVWKERLLHTDMFAPDKYGHHVRLLSADSKALSQRCPSDTWSQKDIVEVVNVVLRRMGIVLEHAGVTRHGGRRGARARKYEHRLCPSDVSKAAELLALRHPSCVEGDTVVAAAIRAACAGGVHAHLARGFGAGAADVA